MSVINQMLQDLEKRGVSTDPARPPESPVRAVHQPKTGRKPWFAAALVALGAAAAVAVTVVQDALRGGSPTPVAEAPLRPKPETSPPAIPAASPAPADTAGNALQPASKPSLEPGAISAPQNAQSDEARGSVTPPAALSGGSPPSAGGPKVAARPESVQERSAIQPATPPQAPARDSGIPAGKAGDPGVLSSAGKPGPADEAGRTPPAPAPGAPAQVPLKPAEGIAGPPVGETSIDKQIRQASPQQRAENEFRRAVSLMQQGRIAEALEGYGQALQFDPAHGAARQAMAGLLLESKRFGEAERILREGLKHNPKHAGFAMALARIQVEHGDVQGALDTLHSALPYAVNRADYHAFMAALLQRQSRHKEAIEQYQAALRLSPLSGVWLMGLGLSLQAEERLAEARDAFKRAQATSSLSPELQAFVDQRLKQIQQQVKP